MGSFALTGSSDRKGGTYEGSYRVPMLARWPGKITPCSVSDQMTMAIGLLPTIARISDAKLPDDRVIDGRDLTGLLSGAPEPIHETLIFFNGDDIIGTQNYRFRLMLNQSYRNFYVPLEVYGVTMLFDLVTDPSERFSFMREQPSVAADLLAKVN